MVDLYDTRIYSMFSPGFVMSVKSAKFAVHFPRIFKPANPVGRRCYNKIVLRICDSGIKAKTLDTKVSTVIRNKNALISCHRYLYTPFTTIIYIA